jgi:hypothetical protein
MGLDRQRLFRDRIVALAAGRLVVLVQPVWGDAIQGMTGGRGVDSRSTSAPPPPAKRYPCPYRQNGISDSGTGADFGVATQVSSVTVCVSP